jgi:alkaline phosphatase D
MSSSASLKRRDFIRGIGAGAVAAAAFPRSVIAATPPGDAIFAHGVASGDPLADRVVIWTRVSSALGQMVPVFWDVALDPDFRRLVRRGRALTTAGQDHTVKIDVPGLPQDSILYYRFRAGGAYSPTGRTRTLPAGPVDQVSLAVFSCSNFPAGYFHAYAEAARFDEVRAAIHLGDYIYEYPRGGYASGDAAALNRESDPPTELLTLADYRRRYAQYRSDPDLQTAHAAMPFICVWDDHEIANNTWRNGAENHDPLTEGDFFARRAAALQAWHEWLPVRTPDPRRLERIYRSFTFGNLVDLHMLDTRVIGRDRQLDYANYLGPGGFDAARFAAELAAPGRQLLGEQQTQWLGQRMQASRATWTMLGQQVLMGRMNVPAPLLLPPALGGVTFPGYLAIVQKARSGLPLTPQEQSVLAQPAIPYNLDAWDGYAVARESVLATSRALDKNLVVLSGDTHNAWANELRDIAGNDIGVEFATPSVTSPGFEEFFATLPPALVAASLQELIDPLVYAQTGSRGFMMVTATASECRADWHFVSSVKAAGYSSRVEQSLRTFPGVGNRRIISA